MRVTFSRLLAATLLTLCVGLQVLEASGQWDRTFQDSGDEAIIITIVLCVGSALVVARVARPHISLSATQIRIVLVRSAAILLTAPAPACSASNTSPPVSLRI